MAVGFGVTVTFGVTVGFGVADVVGDRISPSAAMTRLMTVSMAAEL